MSATIVMNAAGVVDLSLLSTPPAPAEAYHSAFWLGTSFVIWVVLHLFITPIYATAADALHAAWKGIQKLRGREPTLTVFASESWGVRLTKAYDRLSSSKRAYWRRLLRAFIYYFLAVCFGFYFLATKYHSILDLYFVYTPDMDVAFCFAASHFFWCCFEDWPCRVHMGKSNCEQLAVFWGYIVHHVLTAAAYLMAIHTHELATMCVMGLTFEGPVFFSCLREVVSLYDADFNLFDRVPAKLFQANWIITFASMVPCRYLSILSFFYSAVNWRDYLALVAPSVQICYWTFGSLFLGINLYFTWLLTYWYGQDKRYVQKKRRNQAAAAAAALADATGSRAGAIADLEPLSAGVKERRWNAATVAPSADGTPNAQSPSVHDGSYYRRP